MTDTEEGRVIRELNELNSRYMDEIADLGRQLADANAENEKLRTAIRVQANAVKTLQSCDRMMAANDRAAAERLLASCSPEMVESEKEANARLTDELEAVIAAKEAAERQLAKESKRLDWIARQDDEFSFGVIVDAPGDGDYYVRGMGGVYATGKTFREAIDAAIAIEEKRNKNEHY